MQHLSYTTCAQSKSPEKITLRFQNVCFKISQLYKNYFEDASFGRLSATRFRKKWIKNEGIFYVDTQYQFPNWLAKKVYFWRSIFYQHFPSSSQVPELCPRTLQPLEQAQSPKKQRNPASERPMPQSTKSNASVAFIVVFSKLVETGLKTSLLAYCQQLWWHWFSSTKKTCLEIRGKNTTKRNYTICVNDKWTKMRCEVARNKTNTCASM